MLLMFLFGTQCERARIDRRAGAQQRVVGWVDAGRQYQRIVIDGGAAPAVLARGLIDCYCAGVDLLTAFGPGQRRVVRRVISLADRHEQAPLPRVLRAWGA